MGQQQTVDGASQALETLMIEQTGIESLVNGAVEGFNREVETQAAWKEDDYDGIYNMFTMCVPSKKECIVSDDKQIYSKIINSDNICLINTINFDQLKLMFPRAKDDLLQSYLPELNLQLSLAEINTPKRLAFFFANVNEETAGMTNMTENNFTYKDPARARNYFKTNLGHMSNTEIKALGNKELFANTIYANVNGNGNCNTGDGYLYRGRGLFHHTGRENYSKAGGVDFINDPSLILLPSNDVKATVNYWSRMNLNKKVDLLDSNIFINPKEKIFDKNFNSAVKVINTGLSNIKNRVDSYNNYIKLF